MVINYNGERPYHDTAEEIYQYGQIFTATDAIIENVIGSAYSDIVQGNDSDNVISSGNGQDRIYGGAGSDTINAQKGNDIIYGGSGSDIIDGGKGDDEIFIELPDISPGAEDIINGGGGDGDKLHLPGSSSDYSAQQIGDAAANKYSSMMRVRTRLQLLKTSK